MSSQACAVSRKNTLWASKVIPGFLLALVTLAVYHRALDHPFANYDDGEYVRQNVSIQNGVTPAFLKWAFTSIEHANWHPITWISHAVDWQLFGDDAWGHHLTSLLLHIASGVLLFLFLAEGTGSVLRSFVVAALFALHPVNVESVVWIAERKNVLCAAFFFAALLAYGWYARKPSANRYLVVALLFALGLASKAMIVTLPFVLLLLDYWPLRRIGALSGESAHPLSPLSRLALEKVPFLMLSCTDCMITVIAQHRASAIRTESAFPLTLRVENAIVSYAAYLRNTIWPSRLAVLYPYPSTGLALLKVVGAALILIVIGALAWWKRSQHPYLLTGWCWFLGMLVPVIGLVQVGEQAMADRYAYLPLVGIYILLVWIVADFVSRTTRFQQRIAGSLGAVALAGMGALTWHQIGFWKTNLELWTHAVSVTERNSAAEDVVGSELLMASMNQGERYSDQALPHFHNALKIDPKDSQALLYLGMDAQARGRISEAITSYTLALKYVDDKWIKSKILSGIASCYELQGDLLAAQRYYNDALQVNPKPDAESFLGIARTMSEEEIAKLSLALRDHPTAEGFQQLGQLQESIGANDAAHSSYEQARKINSTFSSK